jgi:hypothetical protein
MGGSIMAKTKLSEYSSTAGSNTDVQSVNIGEGMLPSDVNNAMRAIMSHLKNFQTGASSDDLTVGGALSVTSTSSIKVPVGTTAQRPTAATGMIRYNSTTSAYEGYNATAWTSLGGGATGGGTDTVFVENGQTITTSYTLSTSKNAMSVGAITINSGVVVTIPSGARWVVL